MYIRRLQPKDRQQAVQLSDATFRDSNQKSMAEAFPMIFSAQLIQNSYGAFMGDKLVSFMGLVPSTIKIDNAYVNSYSLGSVCTDPDYQGRGYASQLLDTILKDLKKTDASLLLISGDRGLYKRVGCDDFGSVRRFNMKSSVCPQPEVTPEDFMIREFTPLDLPDIARLARLRKVAYIQTPTDLQLLIEAEAYASCFKQKHKVLVLEKNRDIKAFLVVGIPYDDKNGKQGLAIEWAGNSEAIIELFMSCFKQYGLSELVVHIPWQEKELIHGIENLNCDEHLEKNQGTIYILDNKKLLKQLQPFLKKNRGGFENLAIEENKEGNLIKINLSGVEQELTRDAWLSFLFDPLEKENQGLLGLHIPFPSTAGLNYV